MRFVVSSATLYSHLQVLSKVVSTKNTLPILECFLLELDGSTLTLTAADNEIRLVTSLEVSDVEGEGALAIHHRNLLDSLKELPDQPLTFQINDENLEVSVLFQNGKYNFIAQKDTDYPRLKPLSEHAHMLKAEPQALLSGISRTLFATAQDELRPVMNGIYFDITTEHTTFVASDGHKLVRLKNLSTQGGETASFILPVKPANLLKSVLPKEEDTVEIRFDENTAHITLSHYVMTCRFIEGRYPNYASVIPTNNPNKAILDRLSLLNALKRVSVFSNQASGLIKLEFAPTSVRIFAQDLDFSTAAEESVSCQYEGMPIKIGFKSTFLIEVLNNIPSENISIDLSDPSRAGLIFPVEKGEDEDILMLLMPMMLNE